MINAAFKFEVLISPSLQVSEAADIWHFLHLFSIPVL
jgi:hypothetical protein